MELQNLSFENQRPLPIDYKGIQVERAYQLDLVVENAVILELKSCREIEPIHKAQLLTYLKLTGLSVGLLLNFNVPVMRKGIVRLVNHL